MTTLTPVCGATNLPGKSTVQTVRLTEIPGTPRDIYPACALVYDVRGKTIEAAQIACSGSHPLGDGYHYRIAYRAHIFRFHHTGTLTGTVQIEFCDIATTAESSSSWGPGTVNYSATANSYDHDVIRTFDEDEYLYIMYEAVNTRRGDEAIVWQTNNLPTFSITTEEDAGTVTATPSSPSGTLSDATVVTLRWSLSKNPSSTVITGSQIGWRRAVDTSGPHEDNPESYIDVTGTATTYVVTDGRFEAGQSYIWRVRGKNGRNEYGPWSGEISFTVKGGSSDVQEGIASSTPSYPTSSVTANKPVNFRWSIAKGNSATTVTATELQYRVAGDGSDYATLAMVSGSAASFVYEAGFSEGLTIIWRCRSKNGKNVWGDWSGETSFEVKADSSGGGGGGGSGSSGITPSIATPRSGTRDGAQEIIFAWEYNEYAEVDGSEAQWSADEGVTWNALTSAGASLSVQYTAPALTFPKGAIQWRVRGRGAGKWGNWANASFTVEYSARGVLRVTQGATSGSVNAAAANSFACVMTQEGASQTPITLTSAELRWRTSSADAWSSIPMNCTENGGSVSVPAGTFPARQTVDWTIAGVDSAGNEISTDIYSVKTLKSQIDATPARPVNTVELAAEEIILQWRWAGAGDTLYLKAEYQVSTDGSAWSEAVEVTGGSGDIRETTLPAGRCEPGNIYWRVRAYDRENQPGAWSDAAMFLAYGVEDAQNVQADDRPFALVSWEADGQIAFEVMVDSETVYHEFGDQDSFVLPEYLTDGEHSIAVRIQNGMELWSEWVSTTCTTQNDTQETQALTAEGGVDAVLHWTPVDMALGDVFHVYRDGMCIAEISASSYTDRSALGERTYRVVQKKANRYVRIYGDASVQMDSPVTRIAPLSGGEWLALKKTTESRGAQSFQRTREVKYLPVMGSKYPGAEISEHEELSGSYQVSWKRSETEQMARFEALFGRAVILKSRGGRVVTGILESYGVRVGRFETTYTFQIRQME